MCPYHRPRYLFLVLSVLLLIHMPPSVRGASSLPAYNPARLPTAAQAAATGTYSSLDLVGALGPIVETATISGSLAYVGEHNSLAILDTSDPEQPALLAHMPLSGEIKGIELVGNLVYIANYDYGLQIVDVSDPLRPALRGSIPLEGNPSDVDVVGDRAYIPAFNYGLKIVDVSDPANPTLLGSSGSYGSITGVKVIGDLAYIAGISGLIILDISNPASPAFMSLYDTASNGTGNAYNLDVVGNLAYLADGGGGLQIVDVTNPASPTLRGSFAAATYALAVQVAGNLAYMASREYGLFIVDVGNPSAPYLHGSFDTPGSAYDVQIVGGRAYVADYTAGLQIVDTSDLANPTLLGRYGVASNTSQTWIANNLAYVTAGFDGLRIIDVSTPARPRLRSILALPGQAYGIQVIGDRAYVGDWEYGKLFIADISDSAQPVLLGTYQSAQRVTGLEIVANLAYLADGGGGLEIVDISNAASPSLRGKFETQSFARDIDVVGNTAYVASENGGLKIVDVSDPAHPALRGSANVTAAEGVQVVDNQAYIAFGSCDFNPNGLSQCNGGLQIVDISSPASPVARGSYTISGQAKDVRVVGSRAYLSAGNQVLVLDVSDATNPRLLNSAIAQGQAEGVQVDGGLVYITGYLEGLQIFGATPEFVTTKTTITTSGGQAASSDGNVLFRFGTNAVAQPITVLYIGQLQSTPTSAGAGDVARRFIAEARTENGSAVGQLSQPFTIVVDYTDAQLGALGIPETNVNLAYWDGTSWAKALPCAGCGLNTTINRVTARVSRFTQFALMDGQSPTPPSPPLPPTTITPSGGSVISTDGSVNLAFPAGAVTSSIGVSYTELPSPAHALAAGRHTLRSFTLEARSQNGQSITEFAQPYTMTIDYTDAQLAAAGLSEADLDLLFWDGAKWVSVLACEGCGVDRSNNRVNMKLNHFSEFALAARAMRYVFVPLTVR